MANTQQTQNPLSSTFTIITLALFSFIILVAPASFSVYPADLKSLAFFACSLLVFGYFLITIWRRRRLYLNLSPLSFSLFLFGITLLLSMCVTHFPTLDKSLLSLGGLLLAQIILAIAASTLIKVNNSQIIVKLILWLSCLEAVINILVFAHHFFPFIPTSILNALYTPGLSLHLIFLGLGAIGANFFKKNKLKTQQVSFLPLLIIGLILGFALQFQQTPVIPNLHDSLQTLTHQLTHGGSLQTHQLIFGSQATDYADIFQHYLGEFRQTSIFHQASSFPLTLTSLFGILPVIAWSFVVVRTLWLAFSQRENNNHLYFLLSLSFIVQFFTPTSPLILMIQAILIAFATNKNRQTLINLSFATLSDEQVENKDHSRHFFITISGISAIIALVFAAVIGSNYLGYYHHHQALAAITTNNPSQFLTQTQSAVNIAPRIDTFNRYAAIAELELMLQNLQSQKDITDTELAHFYQAVNYAQKAITLEPEHAENYLTLAAAYQEIYSHSDANSQSTLAEQIRAAYAQAALLQPNNPDILLALGGFYQSAGVYDQAQAFYQQALAINPDYALTSYQLATLYEARADFELARTTYQNALQLLDTQAPNYQDNKALIEQKLSTLATNQ
ncbi:hypothetical protein IJJ27_02665 [bacterium]|nr:hypothetical protein [bacterium]